MKPKEKKEIEDTVHETYADAYIEQEENNRKKCESSMERPLEKCAEFLFKHIDQLVQIGIVIIILTSAVIYMDITQKGDIKLLHNIILVVTLFVVILVSTRRL